MIHGHGGDIHGLAAKLGFRAAEIIDVSHNINPLGPPPGLIEHLGQHLTDLCVLPEVDSRQTNRQMAMFLDIAPHSILAGAGTTHFIYTLFPGLASKRILIVGPTYADYADACQRHHIEPRYFLTAAGDRFWPNLEQLDRQASNFDTVVVCNPNNPTGVMLPREALIDLCRRHPQTNFVIDESYLLFADPVETASMVSCRLKNVVVLHSLSKIFRLPGLRLGFIIASKAVISRLAQQMRPWGINGLAQRTVQYLADHREVVNAFICQTRHYMDREKRRFYKRMEANARLTVFPSRASYALIKLPKGITSDEVCAAFARKRILVRNCCNFVGLDNHFIRVAVSHKEINQVVTDILIAL